MDKDIQIGQQITWGDPAFPRLGVVKTMSQDRRIYFVERLQRAYGEPKYETIALFEILSVVEVAHDVQQ